MTQMLSLAGRSRSGFRKSLPGLCSKKKAASRFATSFGFVPPTRVLIAVNRPIGDNWSVTTALMVPVLYQDKAAFSAAAQIAWETEDSGVMCNCNESQTCISNDAKAAFSDL